MRWKIWRRSCAPWPLAIPAPASNARRGRSRSTSAPSRPSAARAPWSRSRIASPPGSRATRASSTCARRRCLEVRPARLRKGSAIAWLRERAGAGARLLALGDDVTDEDMFRSLAAEDESVLVSNEAGRATAARWRLDAPEETERLLRWMLAVRRSATDTEPFAPPRRIEIPRIDLGSPYAYRLLVVSNRLPELRSAADSFDARKRNVGGLVSALEPALWAPPRRLARVEWPHTAGRRCDVLRSRRLRRAGAGMDRLHRRVPRSLLQRALQRRSVAATAFLPEPRTAVGPGLAGIPRRQRGLCERGCSSGRSRGRGVGPRLSSLPARPATARARAQGADRALSTRAVSRPQTSSSSCRGRRRYSEHCSRSTWSASTRRVTWRTSAAALRRSRVR